MSGHLFCTRPSRLFVFFGLDSTIYVFCSTTFHLSQSRPLSTTSNYLELCLHCRRCGLHENGLKHGAASLPAPSIGESYTALLRDCGFLSATSTLDHGATCHDSDPALRTNVPRSMESRRSHCTCPRHRYRRHQRPFLSGQPPVLVDILALNATQVVERGSRVPVERDFQSCHVVRRGRQPGGPGRTPEHLQHNHELLSHDRSAGGPLPPQRHPFLAVGAVA
jgi:hypothetical protein